MKKLVSLCLIAGLAACSPSSSSTAQGEGDVALILGDSLSAGYGLDDPAQEGWVALMERAFRSAQFLKPTQRIVNASVSGETSAGGLERLPDLLEEHHPKLVVIELGANDALRRQSMTALAQNLNEMIDMSQKSGAKVVLVGVDLPAMASFMGGGKVEDVFEQVADKQDVPLAWYPLADLMDEAGMMQDDRLHPTAPAQPLIEKALAPRVKQGLATP